MAAAAGWLQQQMKGVENLLNAVDQVVSKTGRVGGDSQRESQHGGGLSSRNSVSDQIQDEHPTPGSAVKSTSQTTSDGGSAEGSGGFVYASSHSPFGGSNLGQPAAEQQPSSNASHATIPTAQHAVGVRPSAQTHKAEVPAPAMHNNDAVAEGTDGGNSSSSQPPSKPASSDGTSVAIKSIRSLGTQQQVGSKAQQTPPAAAAAAALQIPASMSVSIGNGTGVPHSKDAPTAPEPPISSTVSSSAREAHLARLVDQLKEKLRNSKLENEQLEDMLAQAEARCERERALVASLRSEAISATESKATLQAALTQQLNTQAASLQEVTARCEGLQRQLLQLEGELAVARESSRSIMQNKADLEGGMLEALRIQLSSAEAQLDAERRAHSSTRAAAVQREGELEGQLAANGAALADMQRNIQDYAARVRGAEDALSVALARNQELQQQAGPSGNGAAAERLAALQEELTRLHAELEVQSRSLQQSETARMAAVGEAQTLRTELQALQAELESGARQKDAAQLEASLRELHELLYQKQSQIERLSADRAALQLRLEREVAAASNRAVQQQVDPHHAVTLPSADIHRSGALLGDHSVVPTGSALGERYRHLVSRPGRLGTALNASATLVDRTTALAVHMLRQYPLIRLAALGYLLLLHFYIYWLTLRMQSAIVGSEEPDKPVGLGTLPTDRH